MLERETFFRVVIGTFPSLICIISRNICPAHRLLPYLSTTNFHVSCFRLFPPEYSHCRTDVIESNNDQVHVLTFSSLS